MRRAPQFQASPAPTEEEAAALAAALVLMLEAEAVALAQAAPAPSIEGQTVDPWVAEGRGSSASRGVYDYRDKMPRDRAWRLSGRARVWGVVDVQR